MADRDIVVDRGAASGPSLVSWIALVVGVVALLLAWMAYDQTGANLDERIQQEVQRAVDGTQETQDTTEQDTTPDTTEPTTPDATQPTTPDTTQ